MTCKGKDAPPVSPICSLSFPSSSYKSAALLIFYLVCRLLLEVPSIDHVQCHLQDAFLPSSYCNCPSLPPAPIVLPLQPQSSFPTFNLRPQLSFLPPASNPHRLQCLLQRPPPPTRKTWTGNARFDLALELAMSEFTRWLHHSVQAGGTTQAESLGQ